MDLLMAIGFFIMFLVILGVLIYLIYDYVTYKKNIDETVEQMKRRINRSNVRIQRGYNENASILNNATSNILMNRQDLVDFDNGLKKMFTLTSNDYPVNTSIFDYIMNADPDNNVYKMKLLKRVEAVSGMRVEVGNAANKNFQFCSNNACLNLQMSDSKFKITPSGTNNLEITAANAARSPMANFDFANNSIYLGGDTAASSAMYLNNDGVFVDGDKFKFKGDTRSLKQTNTDLLTSLTTSKTNLKTALDKMNDAIYSSHSNIEFIAQYTLTNTSATTGSGANMVTTYTNTLNVTIVPLYDIVLSSASDVIKVTFADIGNWSGWQASTPVIPSITKDTTISNITRNGNTAVDVLFTSATLTKHTTYSFTLSGPGMLTGGKSQQTSPPVTGITIPTRTNFPTSYPPIIAKTAIDNWYTPLPPAR
jgi:hypothetical protein